VGVESPGYIDSAKLIEENHTKYAKYFESTSKDTLTIETFYKLLMAEMSNQDPMEPVSNTEFISQMATFTSLQTQQEALYYNNANYAQSMVGKTVIVMGDAGANFKIETGTVTRVNFSKGQFSITVNGKEFSLKNVMEVLDGNYGIAGGSDGAFATSLIGKYVTVGLINADGSPVVEEGIVDHVEIKDGEISVVINDIAYPLYSVAKIQDSGSAPVKAPEVVEVKTEEEEEDEVPAVAAKPVPVPVVEPEEPEDDEIVPETAVVPEDELSPEDMKLLEQLYAAIGGGG